METVPESEKLEKFVLNLMNVPFIRYNQLTVSPFPIKYLNEIIRKQDFPTKEDEKEDY